MNNSSDTIASANLQAWFTKNKQDLETAYIAAPTAWQQSGKSGTFEDWTRLRIANLASVQQSGTYLDIGCANGYLLESLVAWARLLTWQLLSMHQQMLKTPYLLDKSAFRLHSLLLPG